MNKRIVIFLLCSLLLIPAFAQTRLPQVRSLESKGWTIQHSVMSWDSLSVYFSAKEPQALSYDLYVLHAEGWRWGEPQRLDAISTDADECWPSVSSDEGMLFYVVNNQIWRAWHKENRWMEAAPLIITGNEDTKPQILEDNTTLLFMRDKLYTASMMDDHNWTLPALVETVPAPNPIVVATGSIVIAKGGRALPTGRVMVYDATNEQLLQTARVHGVTGRWRVPLQRNRHYRLALTAEGYSYQYIDVRTDNLTSREERRFGSLALDDNLALTVNSYDAETQVVLETQKYNLPLGKIHELVLQAKSFEPNTLVVNTQRPTVFTQTELDVPLQPQKSLHHFVITNAKTGERIPNALLRLNGQPTPVDTALRINQEQALQVSAQGFLFADTLFLTGTDTRERQVPVRLLPLEKDLVLQLRNIQFDYDSYLLTESSNDELEAVAQLLFMNPGLKVELSAHTDDQGSDKYNDKLSTLRGQAVVEWLQKRGVEAARMTSVGYGKRKPLVPNDSEANRAINRRVEIKVTEY